MKGVIYCRVSSKEQTEGTSLASQQSSCEEYAHANGIEVVRVFIEEGESAKFADRTQLLALIDFCRERKGNIEALLVWKVDRFARNVADHFHVKATLAKYGVRIISVTEPIDAKPEGKLMETILAGFAQFDNDVRAMRTVQGMRRKIQEGIFPWNPPLGYKTVTAARQKKTRPDEPDQPVFGLLQKAWREFATGAHSKADMLRIMESWGITTRRGKPLSPQSVDNLFGNSFYAGALVDPWSGDEHPGRHIPMVSPEDFARVQNVIRGRNRSLKHHRHRGEFPLRGLVRCPVCLRYLTASHSRGRSRSYPYYHCHNRSCSARGKSIAAERIEAEFTAHLRRVAPHADLLEGFEATALARSSEREAMFREKRVRARRALDRLKTQLDGLITMRAQRLISDEEFRSHRTALMATERTLQGGASPESGYPAEITEKLSVIKHALLNLVDTWVALVQPVRSRFQQIIFPAGYICGNIRTAELGLLFRLFGMLDGGQSNGVPLTYASWNRLEQELALFVDILREEEVKDK